MTSTRLALAAAFGSAAIGVGLGSPAAAGNQLPTQTLEIEALRLFDLDVSDSGILAVATQPGPAGTVAIQTGVPADLTLVSNLPQGMASENVAGLELGWLGDDLLAVWLVPSTNDAEFRSAVLTGGQWGTTQSIPLSGNGGFWAFDRQGGTAALTWFAAGERHVAVATAAGFGPDRVLGPDVGYRTTVDVADGGLVAIGWHQTEDGLPEERVAVAIGTAAGFDDPTVFTPPAGAQPTRFVDPDVAISPDGTVTAAWQWALTELQPPLSTGRVVVAVAPPDQPFGAPHAITPRVSARGASTVQVDAVGKKIVIAWQEYDWLGGPAFGTRFLVSNPRPNGNWPSARSIPSIGEFRTATGDGVSSVLSGVTAAGGLFQIATAEIDGPGNPGQAELSDPKMITSGPITAVGGEVTATGWTEVVDGSTVVGIRFAIG